MKQFVFATLTVAVLFSMAGCNSSTKTTSDEPKTWDNAPQRLGQGLEGAAQGPINAVKTGADAVSDALSSDNENK